MIDKASTDYQAEWQKLLANVLGPVSPEWVPEDTLFRINQMRQHFAERFYTTEPLPAESIIRSMNTLEDDTLEDGTIFYPGTIQDSRLYIQDVSFLVIVRTAIQKGEKDGLPMLLGEGVIESVRKQARAEQASAGGKGKKGHEGPLKQTLREILYLTDDKNLEGVLNIMSDEHKMENLAYPSGQEECTPLYIGEVDYGHKKVLYKNIKTQDEGSTSFKNIENIISQLLKK